MMADDVRRAPGTGTAARLRSDGRWETRVTVGRRGGRQLQRSFFSSLPGEVGQREAERKRDEAIRQLEGGLILAGERLTLERYLRDWLEVKRPPAVRPSTWRRYRQLVELNIVPAIGHLALVKLTPAAVERFLAAATELSPRTRHHVRAVLRSALERAVKHGLVLRNAAQLASPPRVEETERVILAPDQVRQLLEHVAGTRAEALYAVAVATGLRQGEVLGLTWADVDLEAGTLRVDHQLQAGELVPLKTKARRTIGISPATVAALNAHRIRQAQQRRFIVRGDWQDRRGLVFTSSRGRPLSGTSVTHTFQRHLADAGLPRMRFHELRHAAASLMLAEGVELKVVQAILGHRSIRTTADTYTHVLPALMRDAADRMDRVLAGR